MCQQVTHYHPCKHFSAGPLLPCYTPGSHAPMPSQISTPTPCPTCASRPYHPPLPPPGTTYGPLGLPPVSQQFQTFQPYPQLQLFCPPPQQLQFINYPYPTQPKITAPQMIPGPGSYGTPLPVPANTPQSLQWEFVGGQLTPVSHYHPTTNNGFPPFVVGAGGQVGLRTGHNPLHGYDFGGLPPGWNSSIEGWIQSPMVPMRVPGMPMPMGFVPVVNQPAPAARAGTPTIPANPAPAAATSPTPPAQPTPPPPSQLQTHSPPTSSPTTTRPPNSRPRIQRRVAFAPTPSSTSSEAPSSCPPQPTTSSSGSVSGSSTSMGSMTAQDGSHVSHSHSHQSSAADAAGAAAASRAEGQGGENGGDFVMVD
ncbi:hypothetical protein BDZ45DRAFT_430205 [Acephala macrosclerotiorum]|nr:hypothetical protein BDZ45DRAFT_430205 [Acephala macrosclerotiorum]